MYVAVYGFSQSLIYEYKLATYRENTPDTLKHVANLRVFPNGARIQLSLSSSTA